MSVFAGTIVTVGGAHVIDRLQSAGLGNVNVPIDTIREVGNEFVVDKIPQEPTFNWSMESFDVSTDLMAWLTGQVGAAASASAPGSADPAGTEYNWNSVGFVDITSPWKDHASGSAGTVLAGHIVPGLFPTRVTYNFGATASATETVELEGGEFYYSGDYDGAHAKAPIEEFAAGNGSTSAFVTSLPAVTHRVGSGSSTTYEHVWGVIVNGVLQIEGQDYTVAQASAPTPGTATITFLASHIPPAGSLIRYCYFTTTARAWPQTVHASTLVKPGAVRGRNIVPWIYVGGVKVPLHGVQTFTLEAMVQTTATRELGSDKIVGRSIEGYDVNGKITVQSRDGRAFIDFLSKATGVSPDEVFGFFYQNPVPLGIDIQNPKNPSQIIKTLFMPDGQIQPPGTPGRVNQPTDFEFSYSSLSGTFSEFKGGTSGGKYTYF